MNSLSLSLSLPSLFSLSSSLSSSSSRITGSTSQGKDNGITTFLHSLGRYLCYVKRCVLSDVHVHTLRVSVCCTYCINGNMNWFGSVWFGLFYGRYDVNSCSIHNTPLRHLEYVTLSLSLFPPSLGLITSCLSLSFHLSLPLLFPLSLVFNRVSYCVVYVQCIVIMSIVHIMAV